MPTLRDDPDGTTLGQKYYAQFYPMPPAPGWNRVLMQDQFDGVSISARSRRR